MMGWMKVAGRVSLALCVASMSACLKDDNGSGASSVGPGSVTPLTAVWTDQSTAATGTNTDTPLSDVWIDATTVTATGAGAILPSIDEITYGFPKALLPVGDVRLSHPLMTHSSAAAILNPEDQLLTLINNYRLQTLGGLGGVGGGGGLGGGVGVPIGGIAITAIPPSGKLRKNARAHCKHYARYHDVAFPNGLAANDETDTVYTGGIQTPQGRLRKSNITVTGYTEQTLAGATGVSTAQEAFDTLVTGPSIVLTTTAYSYIGIGHWPQGFRGYYWTLILGNSVNPVN